MNYRHMQSLTANDVKKNTFTPRLVCNRPVPSMGSYCPHREIVPPNVLLRCESYQSITVTEYPVTTLLSQTPLPVLQALSHETFEVTRITGHLDVYQGPLLCSSGTGGRVLRYRHDEDHHLCPFDASETAENAIRWLKDHLSAVSTGEIEGAKRVRIHPGSDHLLTNTGEEAVLFSFTIGNAPNPG